MEFTTINPYNQRELDTYQVFSDAQLQKILEESQDAFQQWRTSQFQVRSQLMKSVASVLRDKSQTWAELITREMGKPLEESHAEIEKCAWVCDYYADQAQEFLKDELVESDAHKSWIQYQPLGPVLAIMPWNYPFWQVFRFAAPAIMAGNTALLKHAPNVCGSALNIEKVFTEAGAPQGIFRSILCEVEQVKGLLESPQVKAVTLTGSERAGASVASIAGQNIKKSVLELGGSNAFVVLEDADLDAIVPVAVQARFQNTGQSCIAAKRFVLHRDIAPEFKQRFMDAVQQLKSGDPLLKETDIGPMARVDLAESLEDQVKKSIHKGARLILGGAREKAKFQPTILEDVQPGMPAFDEELFGPVAAISVVDSMEQALKYVNQSTFGLGVTICTSDLEKASYFIDGAEDGAVFVNALVKSDPRLPFGGTKRSGYGRELSYHGIKEFVNTKTVYIK